MLANDKVILAHDVLSFSKSPPVAYCEIYCPLQAVEYGL